MVLFLFFGEGETNERATRMGEIFYEQIEGKKQLENLQWANRRKLSEINA